MINQEEFYKRIQDGHWEELTQLLYLHRKHIASDPLLSHAAQIFEQEFIKRISDDFKNGEILPVLEKLYQLHKGKFHSLQEQNFKVVVLELMKRSPLPTAYNYATEFPDDELSKEIIAEYKQKELQDEPNKPKQLSMPWVEIYNQLFKLINDADNADTYYSGNRFISVIREFRPYHPDYWQYIDIRKQQGKSTGRRLYYYDLLLELSDDERFKVINRILQTLAPFEASEVASIRNKLSGDVPQTSDLITVDSLSTNDNVKVFISYSWDSEPHKQWVLSLANRLMSNGIDVILDQYDIKLGKSLPHFVETAISKANRILIIFTPNYKLKADNRTGGVGYEYSIINASLYAKQLANDKIIPVLRSGSMTESIPDFMQQYVHLDVTNDSLFDDSYTDLLRDIYNEPAIKKPALGKKPSF